MYRNILLSISNHFVEGVRLALSSSSYSLLGDEQDSMWHENSFFFLGVSKHKLVQITKKIKTQLYFLLNLKLQNLQTVF